VFLRIFGWAAVAFIAPLSLVPGEARPHLLAFPKLEHVAAYFLTAAVLTAAAQSVGHFRSRHILLIAVLLPAYAGGLELLQVLIPGRTASFVDVVAGTIGCWLGICAMVMLRRYSLTFR
jgi:VanZ family protein